MAMSLFELPYSNGTHFGDGVRVGPIFGSSYAPGAVGGNFQTPVSLSNPADNASALGVLTGPSYNYFVTPYGYFSTDSNKDQSSNVCLRAAAKVDGADFLVLTNPNMNFTGCTRANLGTSVKLRKGAVSTSVTSGLVFDVPRCVMLTIAIPTNSTQSAMPAYAYGYDAYGFPVVSSITLPAGGGSASSASTVYQIFPKAMKVLLGIYVGGAYLPPISVGISDILGLPYRVNNPSMLTGMWAGGSHVSGQKQIGTAISIIGADGDKTKALFNDTTNIVTASSLVASNSTDVRGLFALPGSNCNTAAGVHNSSYNYSLGLLSKANQLVLQMYLPEANTTKPGVYTSASQYAGQIFPAGITPTVGSMALVPSSIGGKLSYVPDYTDTIPEDLYGVHQYNTDVPGIPFSCN